MTAKSTTAAKPARKGTVRTSNGKRSPVVTKSVAKATRPIPTPEAPLASGWVRQSLAPATGAASKFTTQTQRRLLRAIASGEDFDYGEGVRAAVNVGRLPRATVRTVDRLAALGFVSVAKNGNVAATKAGREFVAANPAPRTRVSVARDDSGIAAAKRTARQNSRTTAKPAKATKATKPAAKATGRKVVRRSAKATA